jgi:hypothetical protein
MKIANTLELLVLSHIETVWHNSCVILLPEIREIQGLCLMTATGRTPLQRRVAKSVRPFRLET